MAAEKEVSGDPSPSAEAGEKLERERRLVDWLQGAPRQRLQLLGVVQIVTGAVLIPTTVSVACLDFSCNVALAMPFWSGITYLLTGFLALALLWGPWRAAKLRALMVLNLLDLILGGCAMLPFGLQVAREHQQFTPCQRRGVLVMKGMAIGFTGLTLLTSLLTLLLLACRKPVCPWQVGTRYQELQEEAEDPEAAGTRRLEAQ